MAIEGRTQAPLAEDLVSKILHPDARVSGHALDDETRCRLWLIRMRPMPRLRTRSSMIAST